MHMLKFYLVNTGNRHFITSNESATGEPLIMLEGCTLSNTVKPEHVSGFTAWGEQRAIAQMVCWFISCKRIKYLYKIMPLAICINSPGKQG
ncbi:hypothetical protein [Citrobacter braakii]|uniref:hypothetical protein n=1 Tax=Citrobacter braakii TaxID=57706 RepID=UPI0028BEAE53|nr:hypothetical protein [Citrobacter braakii]MDT7061662.1 hypothetical protein [Citrobacter braakii]